MSGHARSSKDTVDARKGLVALARLLARQAAREAIAEVAVTASAGVGATAIRGEKSMSSPSRQSGRAARFLSIREVAAYCAVSEKTVRRWIDRRQLLAHQLGRQWRIAPEEIERFLLTRASWQRRFVP